MYKMHKCLIVFYLVNLAVKGAKPILYLIYKHRGVGVWGGGGSQETRDPWAAELT